MEFRSAYLVSLFGGIGGAINALICFLYQRDIFYWHILPAGFVHGAILTFIPLAIYLRVCDSRLHTLIGLIVCGWIAGYLSWIPIYSSLENNFSFQFVSRQLSWPFNANWIWDPFFFFGSVSTIFYAGAYLPNIQRGNPRAIQMGWACISGVCGSAFYWAHQGNPFAGMIHGIIWGLSVGFGMDKLLRGGLGTPGISPSESDSPPPDRRLEFY